ncbi:hypothetical protein [Jannaschia sp. R86511]|uniref:hypothetical protein n=1 Tax=Jannaschia sp. R86511 TaxID=3093853 RepID=UPI0036D394C3
MSAGPSWLLTGLVLQATPEPAELVPDTPDESLVTPGTIGFLVTFFVAVALVLLVRDMNRRVRRVRVRSDLADARLREKLAEERERSAEEAGRPAAATEDPPGPDRRDDPDDGPVRRH